MTAIVRPAPSFSGMICQTRKPTSARRTAAPGIQIFLGGEPDGDFLGRQRFPGRQSMRSRRQRLLDLGKVGEELFRAPIALLPRFFQAFQDDAVEVLRDLRGSAVAESGGASLFCLTAMLSGVSPRTEDGRSASRRGRSPGNRGPCAGRPPCPRPAPGDMYSGVPIITLPPSFPLADRAIPKSMIRALPSLSIMMFCGLRSRWMTPSLWASASPSANCPGDEHGLSGLRPRPLIMSSDLRQPHIPW